MIKAKTNYYNKVFCEQNEPNGQKIYSCLKKNYKNVWNRKKQHNRHNLFRKTQWIFVNAEPSIERELKEQYDRISVQSISNTFVPSQNDTKKVFFEFNFYIG